MLASPRCCIWLSGPGFQDLDIWLLGPGFQDFDIWLSRLGFQDLVKRTLGFRTSIDAHTLRTWVSGPRRMHESSPSYGRWSVLGLVSYLFLVTFLCVQWSQTHARTQPRHFYLRLVVTDRQTHARTHAQTTWIRCIMHPVDPPEPVLRISHSGFKRWRTLLGIEISCSQSKAQACTQGALLLFLLNFGRRGRGGRISFHFSLVPNVFPNIILQCVLSHFHLLKPLKPHPHPLPPCTKKIK